MSRSFHYRWEFDLESSPERLWPLVSDTNRFNRDTGVPAVEIDSNQSGLRNARRRVSLSVFGLPVEWEEQPFEWIRPQRFGVARRYSKGPIKELRVRVELIPRETTTRDNEKATGTKLIYEVWAEPSNLIGSLAIPVQIGMISARNFARAIHDYDKMAKHGRRANESTQVEMAAGGRDRLLALSERLVSLGNDQQVVALLVEYVESSDDFAAARIRPYELARMWQQPRRRVLETCLCATRAGILDLQWNLMCPLCRGGSAMASLTEVDPKVHCPGCNIDFNVNFEQSVELTFRPSASIRKVETELFCVGGPQVMPHVVAQQLLPAGDTREVQVDLEAGRYRARTMGVPGWQPLIAEARDLSMRTIRAAPDGWTNEELPIAQRARLLFENATAEEQLFILERTAWNDEAATASEVTALQVFRDLFATEALRAGEQISVGTLTVLFTDLKNSTRMYREIGDATAFGHVMNHFDVLKEVIAEHDGALVKTIGDAVMAVFRQPSAALKAMLQAQQRIADPETGRPLRLKAGLHVGPCIAVTLNDRLDYFGSTVNLAARLEGQSTGEDIVISSAVYADPGVRSLLGEGASGVVARRFEMALKGFDDEKFELWRVARAQSASV
ncbi:MAG TPA: adenylate/guanylate cyclase domain-containing protein [Pyrinomonadaceae bacterium]|nr:adenylate/guanylate cyclase domain-containing protein [Pyrinomonadaceae bacterium]